MKRKYERLEGGLPIGLSVVDHPSELIQTIGGHNELPISIYKPDDIFIDLYLSRLPDSKDLDFGLRHSVSESMSRRKAYRKKVRSNH